MTAPRPNVGIVQLTVRNVYPKFAGSESVVSQNHRSET